MNRIRCLVAACVVALAATFVGASPARAAEVDLRANVSLYGAEPPDVGAGTSAQFLFGFTSSGGFDAASARLVVELPEGVSYGEEWRACPEGEVGCQPDPGPCAAVGSTVTCLVTNVGPAGRTQFDYGAVLRFDEGLAIGTKLPLRVTVTSGDDESEPADNTATAQLTVAPAADLGVTVEDFRGPAGPANTVSWTVVVHNYGPDPARDFEINEGPYDAYWNWGSTFAGVDAFCIAESVGANSCHVVGPLAPGAEFRLKRTTRVAANWSVWGTKQRIGVGAADLPRRAIFPGDHSGQMLEVDFTGTPNSPTPSPSPSTTGGTAAPAPAPGQGGGLPITGSSTGALAAVGLGLLLAGAGFITASRRRHGGINGPRASL